MGDDAAQRADRRLQLLQRRRIFFGDDQVDLLRQRFHRVFEADQILGRRQTAQRVADFLEPALEPGQHTRDRRRTLRGIGRAALPAPAPRLRAIVRRWRGSASVSCSRISARSLRKDLTTFSSSLDGRNDSIRAVMSRSCSSRLLISTGGSATRCAVAGNGGGAAATAGSGTAPPRQEPGGVGATGATGAMRLAAASP